MKPDFYQWGMGFAEAAAKASDDAFVAVGAAAFTADKRIVATGYNGFPSNMDEAYFSDRDSTYDPENRDSRRLMSLHAEENCCSCFTRGEVAYMFITLQPCSKCINLLIAHDVTNIIYKNPYGREQKEIQRLTKFYQDSKKFTLTQL